VKPTNIGELRAVPRLSALYPAIYLTTEDKAGVNLRQGSRKVPAGHSTFCQRGRL